MLLRKLFILPIRLYQRTLSPDHGLLKRFYPVGLCKYYPSCSEYACQAIEKYGILTGSMMAARRIGRCNPWSEGGLDEVK